MNAVNNNRKVTQVFAGVGKKYGYDSVTAEFTDFKEFKVQWSRSYKFANFRVSDYLEDAPAEVLEGLAATLFAKISGMQDEPYSKAMREWVLAPEFSQKHRPIYIERSKGLTGVAEGNERDLAESFVRLEEAGLVDHDAAQHMMVCWNVDDRRKAAASSLLMKVISVSDVLDDADIPDFVVDYAVYTQYLKILKGAVVFGYSTEVYTRDEETKFAKYKEAERFLDKLNLGL